MSTDHPPVTTVVPVTSTAADRAMLIDTGALYDITRMAHTTGWVSPLAITRSAWLSSGGGDFPHGTHAGDVLCARLLVGLIADMDRAPAGTEILDFVFMDAQRRPTPLVLHRHRDNRGFYVTTITTVLGD